MQAEESDVSLPFQTSRGRISRAVSFTLMASFGAL